MKLHDCQLLNYYLLEIWKSGNVEMLLAFFILFYCPAALLCVVSTRKQITIFVRETVKRLIPN